MGFYASTAILTFGRGGFRSSAVQCLEVRRVRGRIRRREPGLQGPDIRKCGRMPVKLTV
jgi:hypothetical protein